MSGQHILSSRCFNLLIHFRGWCQKMATLDTSFRHPFELYNGSLENAYICFLVWPPQHRNGNSNPMHFNQYECHCAKFSTAKTFEWRKVTQDLRYGGPLEMLTIAKLIKINVLVHQFSNLTFNLHYMCLNFAL